MMGAFSDLLARANHANHANPKPHRSDNSPNSHDSQTVALSALAHDSPNSQDSQAVIAKIRQQLHSLRGNLPAAFVDSIDAEDVLACDGVPRDALAAYLRALARRLRMVDGEVPAGWTRTIGCAGCGPVMLWPDAPHAVIGCPWCHGRKAGRIIPGPATAEKQSKQSKASTDRQDGRQ